MLESNHERYMALVKEGKITAAESMELIKAFPVREVDDQDKVVCIVDISSFEDAESSLLQAGYRHRQRSIGIHEFHRKSDNSFRRFTVDPWLR